jgi:hypothetical protein
MPAWSEEPGKILPEPSLVVEDPFFRRCEWELRRKIYRWTHIKDDEIIDARVYVPIERTLTDWIEGRVRPYSNRVDRSAQFSPFPSRKWGSQKAPIPGARRILEINEAEPFYSRNDARGLTHSI